jgi:hypothetical protein
MSESEWLACTRPFDMLSFLRGKFSDRKFRLFACAAYRRLEPLMRGSLGRHAIEVSEAYVDGQVTFEVLTAARTAWGTGGILLDHYLGRGAVDPDGWFAAVHASNDAVLAVCQLIPSTHRPTFWGRIKAVWRLEFSFPFYPPALSSPQEEIAAHVGMLRCLFGNPFRPITIDPSCLTSTVQQLAQAIYDDRAFDRLPILADALEDAGCDNTEILNHCRQPGVHVRGCWVIDLLLQKE